MNIYRWPWFSIYRSLPFHLGVIEGQWDRRTDTALLYVQIHCSHFYTAR